jgi:hypothetical protein
MATRYLGVVQVPSGRFEASIRNDAAERKEYIGTFGTAEDAARAFDARAVQLGGAHRKLHSPTSTRRAAAAAASRRP